MNPVAPLFHTYQGLFPGMWELKISTPMTQRRFLLVIRLRSIIVGFLAEFLRFGRGLLRPRASLVAENLSVANYLNHAAIGV